MHANVGDRFIQHGRNVGMRTVTGEILEVRGSDGAPPYVIRFEDGREQLVFPGPDAEITPRSTEDA